MSVPAWDYGLPAAVVRLKARAVRERERLHELRLSGALDALVSNQQELARMMASSQRGDELERLQ